MTDPDRGSDRAGRRAKRFLTPLQKYVGCRRHGPLVPDTTSNSELVWP